MSMKASLARATGIGYRSLQPLAQVPERAAAANAAKLLDQSAARLIRALDSPGLDEALRKIETVIAKKPE